MPPRRTKHYRNPIKPWLVANGLIAGVILAFLGMVYGWLGWKKNERGGQKREAGESIRQLKLQLQAQQVRMNTKLMPNELQQRADSLAPGLVPITNANKEEVSAAALADYRKQHEPQSPH